MNSTIKSIVNLIGFAMALLCCQVSHAVAFDKDFYLNKLKPFSAKQRRQEFMKLDDTGAVCQKGRCKQR